MLPLISRNDTVTTVVSINSSMAHDMAVIISIHLAAPVGYTSSFTERVSSFFSGPVVFTISSFSMVASIFYLTFTFTKALRPGKISVAFSFGKLSIDIRNGKRCVILIKFPVALSGGSKENLAPVAPEYD